MKMKIMTTAGVLLVSAAVVTAGQYSPPVGYTAITVPANSDAVVSVPFTEKAEFTAAVDDISQIGSGQLGVDVTLTASAYAGGGYYLRITSGASEGLWSTITANGIDGVTVGSSAVLSSVQAGDGVAVFAHQTLGSVFPPEMENVTFKASTQILVPNTETAAINKSAAPYTFKPTGFPPFDSRPGWYQGITYGNDLVIAPESYVIIRNGDASNLVVAVTGLVPVADIAQILAASGSANDLYLSGLPVDMTFGELNLGGLGQLLVINNSASGINKSPVPYTWKPTGFPPFDSRPGWYQGITYANDTVVPAGTGVILRRDAGTTETTWTLNNPY